MLPRKFSMFSPLIWTLPPSATSTTSSSRKKRFCVACEVPGSSELRVAIKVAGSQLSLNLEYGSQHGFDEMR